MTGIECRSGIYMCRCTVNNQCYIGQSRDIKFRIQQHRSALKCQKHWNAYLQNCYNKYGKEAFEWTVLEYCDPEQLNEREIYYISKLNTFENGFNLTEGGTFNRVYKRSEKFKQDLSKILKETWSHSPERRKAQSVRMKINSPMRGKTGPLNPAWGKDHSGIHNGMFGKNHSEESKEKNRQAHLGIKNKRSIPVICIETGELFASQGEAGRAKGISDIGINKACRGVIHTTGGFHWRYATEEEVKQINYT